MTRRPYYIVACKDDGVYVMATSRTFHTRAAAELYTTSIAASREPIIILVD